MAPVDGAVRKQTTSVPAVAEPIWTQIPSPAGHPVPLTVNPVPAGPEPGVTETVGVTTVRLELPVFVPSVAETVWLPAVVDGTVNVTPEMFLFESARMLVGLVVRALPSNLNPDTV